MFIKIFRFLIFLIVFNVNCKEFTLHDGSVVKDADKIFRKLQYFAGDSDALLMLYIICDLLSPKFNKCRDRDNSVDKLISCFYNQWKFKIDKKDKATHKLILNSIVVNDERCPTQAVLINPFKLTNSFDQSSDFDMNTSMSEVK